MSLVYSKRLATALHSAGGTTHAGVCPAGRVWVALSALLVEESGAAGATAIVNAATVSFMFQKRAAADNGIYTWSGRLVLNPTEGLDLAVFSGTWSLLVSGYELVA